MSNKIIYRLLILFLFVLISVTLLLPSNIYSESQKVWVDTSHWEIKKNKVEDGYWQTTPKRRWVDTSYTITQGYWENYTDRVWVSSGYYEYYNKTVWVDASHWETRYRDVDKWVSTNLTIYVGTDSYGWSVYSGFAKKQPNIYTIIYKGNKYHANKWIIDYRPVYGGQVYAIKYKCYEKLTRVKESYKAWIKSGYWQTVKVSYWVDTSHWKTVTGRKWVDTSYTVTQGYWENYTEKEWIDTSYYEYEMVWIEDGFYTTPLHGVLIVEKNPKYVFTRWHKDNDGDECGMELNISWKVDNSNLSVGEEEKKIARLYVYEDIYRFNNNGVQRVIIFDGDVAPASEGGIDTLTKFEYSGSKESMLHIYLFAQNGESAHINFSNPVNGFRSINVKQEGSDLNASKWLGGISYEEFEF